MINYHHKLFRIVSNTENGEVTNETLFHYEQQDSIVTATYRGGSIIAGHLIAIADINGVLNAHFQHVNKDAKIMTGICATTPEMLSDGRLRLYEKWKWSNGDLSEGESVLEEIEM